MKRVINNPFQLKNISLFCAIVICSLILHTGELSSQSYRSQQAIAVWAYQDSNTVNGIIHPGVVAYHAKGIQYVGFRVDSGSITKITGETVNPVTKEYEFVFTLDTRKLKDGPHKISAFAVPMPGQKNILPELKIIAANNVKFKTWYVDILQGNDKSGNGSEKHPWKTIGRALGTQWPPPGSCARSGDTVLIKPGTYSLPDGQYGKFNQYVTLKPYSNSKVIISGGGYLRSSFIKFENIYFKNGAITAYAHHIWIKGCTYSGKGVIWPDTINIDEAFRSRVESHDFIVENTTVHDANQGISLIGQGNYIIRNCHIYNQNGDAIKFMGDNVLITGNRIHHIIPPRAWSVSKKNAPYNCSGGGLLTFRISRKYGRDSFPDSFRVKLKGANNSTSDIIKQLNADSEFVKNGFQASISKAPYPFPGNIRIELTPHNELYRFYIIESPSTIFRFSDNTRALNNITEKTPAMHTTDHCDCIANDARNSSNIIIRNNTMYDLESQGLKVDSIGNKSKTDFYKKNIAIVNNLFAGKETSARMLYFNYMGSGAPRSKLHYDNILVIHNTIMKPATGLVRFQFTLDMKNPYITNFIIKNNIIGDYFTGDWPLRGAQGISCNNLFADNRFTYGSHDKCTNSILANPDFIDRNKWDFNIKSSSPACKKGEPGTGIRYDINWKKRNTSAPSIGAYE